MRKEVEPEEAIRTFDREVTSVLGPGAQPEYTVEPRVCGLEVSLLYERGRLSSATARSTSPGKTVDVTANIRTILTVPLELLAIQGAKSPPDRMGVWGIAYLEAGHGKEGGSSPLRERVAASLVGADLKETARRPYNLFCYGLEGEPEAGVHFGVGTHFEVMLSLQNLGLRVNRPHIRHCHALSAVIENICALEGRLDGLPYDVDGAVVQVNPLTQRRALEEKGADPFLVLGFDRALTAASKFETIQDSRDQMAESRIRLVITGRVQGVSFRAATRREALSLGVSGWVRNRPDGSVEVVAEGAEEAVRNLAQWCHRGPSSARVTRVDQTEEPWKGEFDDFEVAY